MGYERRERSAEWWIGDFDDECGADCDDDGSVGDPDVWVDGGCGRVGYGAQHDHLGRDGTAERVGGRPGERVVEFRVDVVWSVQHIPLGSLLNPSVSPCLPSCIRTGWFILLTSLGGYWRVKRFERSLQASQQTDAAAGTASTNAEPSSSRSWFAHPGASGEESEEGSSGQNVFQRLGGNVRAGMAGVRDRIETMRREREGRSRVADGDEDELML